MKKTGIVFAASIMAIGMVLSGCSAPAGEETSTETTEEVTTTTTTEETTASETEESETDTEESKADENEGKVLKTKTYYAFERDQTTVLSLREANTTRRGLLSVLIRAPKKILRLSVSPHTHMNMMNMETPLRVSRPIPI